MKLFTKSSILKSTTVEVVSPRILELPDLEKAYKKLRTQSVAVEFPMLSGELIVQEASHDYQPVSPDSIAHQRADELLQQAQNEAEYILAQARAQAEEILQKANDEKGKVKQAVEEAVRKEVLPLAHAEGYEAGIQEATREAQRLKKQSKAYLELAQSVLMDEYHRADRELVNLCLQISQRIIHTVLDLKPETLLSVIRNLTLLPHEKEGIKIHLSSRDWEWYKQIEAEDKPSYPVVIDESLKEGDAFLECAEGIFDAHMQVQLEKVKQYLIEELEDGRLDGFSTKDGAV